MKRGQKTSPGLELSVPTGLLRRSVVLAAGAGPGMRLNRKPWRKEKGAEQELRTLTLNSSMSKETTGYAKGEEETGKSHSLTHHATLL